MLGKIVAVLVMSTLILGSYALVSIAITKSGDSRRTQFPPGSQVLVPLPTMSAEQRSRFFQPGKPWDGIGKGISQAEAEAFSEFPLFWFGPSVAGFNLQTIEHVKYASPEGTKAPGMNRVTFIYGSCTPDTGKNRCPVPALIHIQPVCAVLPDQILSGVKTGGPEARSGALFQRFADGHVMIWTGSILLDINTWGKGPVTDSDLNQLQGIGLNRAAKGQLLGAPNLEACTSV